MPFAPARVLSNLALPSPSGITVRAFHDYLPPGTDPSAPHPEFARRALRDILPLIPSAERPEALIIASPEYRGYHFYGPWFTKIRTDARTVESSSAADSGLASKPPGCARLLRADCLTSWFHR